MVIRDDDDYYYYYYQHHYYTMLMLINENIKYKHIAFSRLADQNASGYEMLA